MKEAENSGQFSYEPIRSDSSVPDDDENFDDANETPMKSTTDSPMVQSSIPAQSPMNSSVSLKPTVISSLTRESSTNSRASSIKSTTATVGSVRQSSLSDLEKELQEFDIDLDQDDDVSDASNPPSASAKGARKKSTEENEVNTRIEHTHLAMHPCTSVNPHRTLLSILFLWSISNSTFPFVFRISNSMMMPSTNFSRTHKKFARC